MLKLDFLRPEHFHQRENRQVFEACMAILQRGGSPDYVTVTEHSGLPAGVVGYYREFDEGSDNVEEYGQLIVDKATSRELIRLGDWLKNKATTADDPADLLDEAEKKLMATRPQRGDGFQPLTLLERAKLTVRPRVTPTGYGCIDHRMKGLGRGQLICLAARPGIGKTTLAENFVARACKQGLKAAVFSMEMGKDELTEKLVYSESGVSSDVVEEGRMTDHDITSLGRAMVRMNQWSLDIDETPSLSVFEISARAKRLKAEKGLDLLVIDYLQLISWPKGVDNAVTAVTVITRQLKVLARQLDVPLLMLSQLSRAAEQGDGEPQLHHLRDSGSIEQDCDKVIFLWLDRDQPLGADPRFTHGKLAKNRQGATGTFELALLGSKSQFVEA